MVNTPEFVTAAKEAGHDSVFGYEAGRKTLGTFYPHQIKSATGNRGTYDTTDPDITKADGGNVKGGLARLYQGSPHKFEPTANNPLGEFDPTKIGTGEGAQVYGHGHYLAENPNVAKSYKNLLSLAKRKFDVVNKHDESPVHEKEPGYEHVKGFLDTYAGDMRPGDIEHRVGIWDRDLGHLQGKRASEINDLSKQYASDPENLKWVNEMRQEDADKIKHLKAAKDLIKKTKARPKGHIYHVEIPHEHMEKMLDWDKPLSEQHERVKDFFASRAGLTQKELAESINSDPQKHNKKGKDLYKAEVDEMRKMGIKNAEEITSRSLKDHGLTGIKYLDQGSRFSNSGTRNYVVFPGNEHLLKIVHREKNGGVVYAADGGTVKGKAMPTIAQMKMALSRNPDLRNMGVNQAIGSRAYANPDPQDNGLPPVGGVSDQNGLPVGGVDTDSTVPGQQMTPQAPNQPTQPFPPAQGGMQPPMTVGIQQQPPQMGNMLSMTPQGQTLDALAPAGMPGKAEGGSMPVYTHHVVDPQDNHRIMGKYQSASTARKARDRLDNQYGSYRYKVTMIPQAKEAVREVLKKGGQVNKDMMKLELSKKKVK